MVSSRVGEMITTCGLPPGCLTFDSVSKACKIGSINAAVFPDPVWAHAIRSLLARMIGMAVFWIGVGSLYPDFSIFDNSKSDNPDSRKLNIGAGAELPVTLILMLSYFAKFIPEVIPWLNISFSSFDGSGGM